jgi:hypothetical protein
MNKRNPTVQVIEWLTYMHASSIRTGTYTRTYIPMHAYVRTYIHTYMHTGTHTYTQHTYIHTHIHTTYIHTHTYIDTYIHTVPRWRYLLGLQAKPLNLSHFFYSRLHRRYYNRSVTTSSHTNCVNNCASLSILLYHADSRTASYCAGCSLVNSLPFFPGSLSLS